MSTEIEKKMTTIPTVITSTESVVEGEVIDHTATLVKDGIITQVGASQKVYRLDPSLEEHEYVVVSAVNAMFSGPETLIFPSDAEGHVKSFLDLEGSFQGDMDHEQALRYAGYEVV